MCSVLCNQWLQLIDICQYNCRLQEKLQAAEDELFELETQWTSAKARVSQLRVQARSAEELALRTRSAAQVPLSFLFFSGPFLH